MGRMGGEMEACNASKNEGISDFVLWSTEVLSVHVYSGDFS